MDAIKFLAGLPSHSARICLASHELLKLCDAFLDPAVRPHTTHRETVLGAYLGRIVFWMSSLAKLGDIADVQPIGAAARALLEVAADSLFVHGDRTGYVALRIEYWSQSAQFDAGEKVVNFYKQPGRTLPARYASLPALHDSSRAAILMHRVFLSWGKDWWKEKRRLDHPSDWDGSLRERCDKLDKEVPCNQCQQNFDATMYYVENFRLTCWLVHGSGFLGFKSSPGGMAKEAARMTYNCWRFAGLVSDVIHHEFGAQDARFSRAHSELKRAISAAGTYFHGEYDKLTT